MAVIDCVLNIMQPSATRWHIALRNAINVSMNSSTFPQRGVNFPAVTSDNCRVLVHDARTALSFRHAQVCNAACTRAVYISESDDTHQTADCRDATTRPSHHISERPSFNLSAAAALSAVTSRPVKAAENGEQLLFL